MRGFLRWVLTSAVVMAASGGARAELLGAPTSGEIGFQPINSDNAADIVWFHNVFLLPVTIGISALVFALLAYVVINFNERVHPTPSKTTHNWRVEAVWTIVPALVLIVIAFPSIRLLHAQMIVPTPDLVLKATAAQWQWRYEYPKDVGGFQFDSLPKDDSDLDRAKGDLRLLTVDNEAVVPVGKDRRSRCHLARRHPRFRRAVARHTRRRHSGTVDPDLVQRRPRGRVLRPVLQHLRHRPRLHADRDPRRESRRPIRPGWSRPRNSSRQREAWSSPPRPRADPKSRTL